MLYAVIFEDNPSADPGIRPQLMPDHLAFLEEHPAIRDAGPLTGDGTDGGLWLVEAESRAKVQALVEADPFWPTGLRAGVRILAWRQVFKDGKRNI